MKLFRVALNYHLHSWQQLANIKGGLKILVLPRLSCTEKHIAVCPCHQCGGEGPCFLMTRLLKKPPWTLCFWTQPSLIHPYERGSIWPTKQYLHLLVSSRKSTVFPSDLNLQPFTRILFLPLPPWIWSLLIRELILVRKGLLKLHSAFSAKHCSS